MYAVILIFHEHVNVRHSYEKQTLLCFPKSFSVESYCQFAMHIDRRRDPHPLTFILTKKDVITLKSKNKTQSKNVSLIN